MRATTIFACAALLVLLLPLHVHATSRAACRHALAADRPSRCCTLIERTDQLAWACWLGGLASTVNPETK